MTLKWKKGACSFNDGSKTLERQDRHSIQRRYFGNYM